MALKEQIANDMKAALLGGSRFEGEVLRGLKAAILNEEVATGKRDEGLADQDIEKVIAREIKKRREAAKMYRENSREDLAGPEEQEAAVLEKYLPDQLGEDEILHMVKTKIAELGASGPQSMGQVIGAIKQAVGNTVDGGTLARIVKEELSK